MKPIVEALSSPKEEVRVAALERAGTLLPEEAAGESGLAQVIIGAVNDPSAAVRRAALEAIAGLAHRSALAFPAETATAVAKLSADEDPRVRSECAVVLAILVPNVDLATVREILVGLLEDPVIWVRREAAAALGDLGDRSAADLLARRLEDEDEEMRFEAAFALASLKDDRGLAELHRALATPNRRLDVCEAFRRLGNKDAIPALRRVSKSFFLGWPERLMIGATLYSLGDVQGGAYVIERLSAWNREERALAVGLVGTHRIVEAVPVVEELASKRDSPLLGAAVRSLGENGLTRSAAILEGIANDEEVSLEVRLDAVQAIAKLPDRDQTLLARLARSGNQEIARSAAALLEK